MDTILLLTPLVGALGEAGGLAVCPSVCVLVLAAAVLVGASVRCCIIVLLTANLYCSSPAGVVFEDEDEDEEFVEAKSISE